MAFYLDWQVISYLSDPSALKGVLLIDILCLQQIFEMADRDKLVLPYSVSHLADIRKGPGEKHALWLGWLKSSSKCWNVLEIPEEREKIGFRQVPDVRAHFDSYCAGQRDTAQETIINPLIDAIVKQSKEQARIKIEESESVFPKKSIVYQRIQEMLRSDYNITGIDIMRFNKTLRGELRDTTGKRIRFPEIPAVKKKLFSTASAEFRILVDDAMAKSDLPFKNFKEFDTSVPSMPTGGFLSKSTEKINKLCMLATFWGIGTEKIKRSSSPAKFEGMVNDLGHLSLGLRCNGLVSTDNAMIEKAMFAKKMLGLYVDIFRPGEFVRKILKDFAKFYEEQNRHVIGEQKEKYTFNFLYNKELLRSYVIDLSEGT